MTKINLKTKVNLKIVKAIDYIKYHDKKIIQF